MRLYDARQYALLRSVLEQGAPTRRKSLIFLETKRACDGITRQLRYDGFPALALHGDKAQPERDWVMAQCVAR